MKAVEVIEIATGEKKLAIYAPNKKGNKQFNVEGKFYLDSIFDDVFKIIPKCECGLPKTWFKGKFICSDLTCKK